MAPLPILVIEDDYTVARTIERCLTRENFQVSLASRGEKGLALARQNRPALIILDIVLPDVDGYQICRQLRSDPLLRDVPVLFLTARLKPQEKIAAFLAGGDDYLCKPFNVEELLLRVRAILRRTHLSPSGATHRERQSQAAHRPRWVRVGEYALDTQTFELHTPHRGVVRLTPVQYDLLYVLMSHPGQPFSPLRLLDEVWDFPSGRGSPDLVRVHIKALRRRVEEDPASPSFIRTIPGQGYLVAAPIKAPSP